MKPFTEEMSLRALLKICKDVVGGPVLFLVHEGGDWAMEKPSDNIEEVVRASNSTGEDILFVYDAEGKYLGYFYLIWGNDPSGEELMADYGVNPFTDKVSELHAALYA